MPAWARLARVVEIKDGEVTCWTGSQKPHFVQNGIAAHHRRAARTRCASIWVVGPGSYGRSDADDAAMDAAVLAKAIGPAGARAIHARSGHRLGSERPRLDPPRACGDRCQRQHQCVRVLQQGVLAHRREHQRQPAARHAGRPLPRHRRCARATTSASRPRPTCSPTSGPSWETIPPFLDRASPLRTSHLRDPVGPQIHFASESFMDEVAAALNVDPVEFRLRHLKDPRDIAVIKAAAEKAGWKPRPSPRKRPERQHRHRPRHRLCAAQRHAGRDRRSRSKSTADRQDLGAAGSPSRMTAARSSTRSGCSTPSKATSSRASAARSGKRCKFDNKA